MEQFFFLFVVFASGIFFNVFWGYILGLGYGVMVFRATTVDCLLLMTKNIQSVIEINEIKYLAFKIMNRDEKFIEFQKLIDEKESKSLKNMLIRNYINSVPPRFNNAVQFHDWESAMVYLDGALKQRENE